MPKVILIGGDTLFGPVEGQITSLIHTHLGTRALPPDERARTKKKTFSVEDLFDLKTKSQWVDSAMPILEELVRSLVKRTPEFIEPELTLIDRRSAFLRDARVVGGSTFAEGTAYAQHPYQLESYLPLASYHRYLLDEKRAEFERIASALGAKSITVIEKQSTKNAGDAKTGPSNLAGPVDLGATGKTSRDTYSEFNLEAFYEKPPKLLSLPKNLKWLQSEPQWQAMVDGRLGETSILRRRTRFQYISDFSVNLELAAKVARVGFSCGGAFESQSQVDVDCLIEFFPKSE